MTLTFWDNSDEVKAIIEAIGIAWLHLQHLYYIKHAVPWLVVPHNKDRHSN